ncbi:hypothetical protein ACJIZ3_006555 [Penstemon smallii]|uniref:Leucine-rich repeat-containing N-terminal plant-type domain-containing protein n=1 Tax=Penstemon smallii TaxID=265156 RepID=A0ABD3S809_9LAMI
MLSIIFKVGNTEQFNRRVQCLPKERIALLKLKAELIDDYGRLSTWGNNIDDDDCCGWKGVICDNTTNHVVALDLQGDGTAGSLRGNLSMLRHLDLSSNDDLKVKDNLDWLTGLHSLEYLDLSYVNLEMASSTWWRTISNLKTLKALYLRSCGLSETTALSLSGTIINDSSTTTSSSLAILDLSSNNLNSTPTLIRFLNLSISISYIDFSSNNFDGRILDSLGHLLSLSHLDLSNNQLQGDFPQSFKNLVNLRLLNFMWNELNGQFFQMMTLLENSTKLEYIDFTENALVGPFPNMSRFSFLKELKLQDNKLNGPLLGGNLNLPHLEVLDVSRNRFSGRVPDLTSCSSSLRELSLNDNMFNGTLTESIGYLSKLEDLSLGSNQLEGIFSEAHLFNLSRLQNLDLSFNSNLTVKISSSWNPPFQLYSLWSEDCNLGPDFPEWLQRQKQLTRLHISNTKIQDIVPDWFWDNFHWFTTSYAPRCSHS